MWVHQSLTERQSEDEYFELYRHSIENQGKYIEHVRIDSGTFHNSTTKTF